jgi:hypothetical protein
MGLHFGMTGTFWCQQKQQAQISFHAARLLYLPSIKTSPHTAFAKTAPFQASGTNKHQQCTNSTPIQTPIEIGIQTHATIIL